MANNEIDPAAAVATLAAEVEALRDQIAGIPGEAELNQLQREVNTLAGGLEALANQIVDTTEVTPPAAAPTATDETADGSRATAPKATAWVDATEATAPDFLSGVADWVRGVVPYLYPRLTLPDCWYEHPSIVQVLADARIAWITIYRSRDSVTWLLIDWHRSYWPDLVKIIDAQASNCLAGRHEARPPRDLATRSDFLQRIVEQWVQRDTHPPN